MKRTTLLMAMGLGLIAQNSDNRFTRLGRKKSFTNIQQKSSGKVKLNNRRRNKAAGIARKANR